MMPAVSSDTEETQYGRFMDWRLFTRFLSYATPYGRWIAAALCLLPVSALVQLAQPLLIKRAVDQHLLSGTMQGFNHLVLFFVVLVGVQFISGYLQSTINTLLGQKVVRDIRRDLYNHVVHMDAAFFAQNASGRLTNRITNDTEAISQMVSSGLINLIGDLILLIGVGISMFILSPKLSSITLLAMPIIVIGTVMVTHRMRLIQRQGYLLQARMAGQMTEEIDGHSVLRIFHSQERSRDKFAELNCAYFAITHEGNFWEAFQFSFIETASTVIIAGLFWYGSDLTGKDGITIGVFVAFIDYIRRIFFPIRDLSGKFTTMQAAMTALERIFNLLDTPPAIANTTTTVAVKACKGEICFTNVTFSYGKETILADISCRIRPGERVAIVGPTGAGKSSLIKLLNRTYEPQRGEVSIDGIAVSQMALTDLRLMVGVIQQDTFLFAGTIADNISLHHAEITMDRIQAAASATGAMEFIAKLPNGLLTSLAERGVNLSSGQRQLLGITRVLAFNSAILVMDEATSSVDTISEEIIRNALNRLLQGRTALIIAHRLSTILNADRILVLAHGRIVEEGSHAQLLMNNGLYAKLYAIQFQENA